MELRNIEQLLERYFEGESTLQEEQQLRDYFTGDAVAPHLEEYVGLFSAFAKAEIETYDAPIVLPERSFRIPAWASVAAIIAICIGIFIGLNKRIDPQITGDDVVISTYEPEIAILKTKQALSLVSQMISQSTAQLGVVKEFDNATSNFIKQ